MDAADKLDEQPRATHYNSPATRQLHRAGVLEDVRAAGFIPRRVAWRKADGTFLAGLDGSVVPEDSQDRMVCLPLNRLGKIILQHLQSIPSVDIKWSHNVVSLGQDETKAWVDVDTPEGRQSLDADYIIGCDGANSIIRRALQGDMNFPGKTWDEQIVATNVRLLLK